MQCDPIASCIAAYCLGISQLTVQNLSSVSFIDRALTWNLLATCVHACNNMWYNMEIMFTTHMCRQSSAPACRPSLAVGRLWLVVFFSIPLLQTPLLIELDLLPQLCIGVLQTIPNRPHTTTDKRCPSLCQTMPRTHCVRRCVMLLKCIRKFECNAPSQ